MTGWHHQLNGHEFEWTQGVGDGQGGLGRSSPWDSKELDMTERLNLTRSQDMEVTQNSSAHQEMIGLRRCVFYISLSILFPGGSVVKNLPANAGDPGLIPGLGRSPGVGNSNPLQYSCLENSTDRGAWRATVHGIKRVRHNCATNTYHSQ